MTEEELREMEQRAAWEEAARAAQARKSPPPPVASPPAPPPVSASLTPVDVNSLPNAPEEPSAVTRRPLTFAERAEDIANSPDVKPLIDRAVGANPIGAALKGGQEKAKERATPNTEDSDDPALLARRQAGLTASGEPAPLAQPGGPEPSGGASGPGEPPPFRSSPGVVVPGGMQPYSEKREVKEGIPVGPDIKRAYEQAEGMRQEAAGLEHVAQVGLQPHIEEMERQKLAAIDRARIDHQRLADERNLVVQERMNQIEQLNKEAQGKPEDLWNSGTVFARVIGTLLSAVGFVAAAKGGSGQGAGLSLMSAGGIINGLVNEDIASKREARAGAAAQAKRQTDLLHLHEQNFKDRDQAIDATKLAYYDNILQNMEVLKAGPYANQINKAKYEQLQAQLLNERAQLAERISTKEAAQIQGESVQHYRPPQVVGGGGGGPHLSDIPATIALSDGTTWALGNSPDAEKATQRIVAAQKLKDLNTEIKRLRHEAYGLDLTTEKGRTRYAEVMSMLEDKGAQKAPLMSQALDGSTIRKDERDEIEKKNVKATEGIGLIHNTVGIPVHTKALRAAADATLDAQSKQWEEMQKTEAAAAGGRQVQRGYVRNEHGELEPVARYLGRDAYAPSALPPNSFKPDAGSARPTQGKPMGERFPAAPYFGEQHSAPPKAGGHKKKKEE